MPRNRMIKAEFWADEKAAACSLIARLLFIGSWNFADDSGVCRANSAYLRNNIFPYDSINIKDIDKALLQLQENGLISIGFYKGEKYLLIKNFLKHQKINRPSELRYVKDGYDKVFNDYSLQTHGGLSEPSLLKEKEKEKENVKVKEEVEEENATASTSNFSQNLKDELNNWYGEYSNVHLTKTQYGKLLFMIANKDLLDQLINELSENIASKKEKAKPFDENYPAMHFLAVKKYWDYRKTHPEKFKTSVNKDDEKKKRLAEMKAEYEKMKSESG